FNTMAALAHVLPPNASNSVAVQFPGSEYPRSLEQATNFFARYGDIARLDTTLGAVTGLIFVTFFDVRCTQKVLKDLQSAAEPFPPAAHDFRAVSIATSVFAELPAAFTGFQKFGEIAGVSIHGEDMVVEFYDIRAAQQVTFAVPGSRPRRPGQPADPARPTVVAGFASATPTAVAGYTSASSEALHHCPPQVVHQGRQAPMTQQGMDAFAKSLAEKSDLLTMLPGQGQGVASQGMASSTPEKKGPTSAGPGKPLREKVRSQDLSKFDICADKIKFGQDSRTTVMVRNIPKVCSREAFVDFLVPCGLEDRYTFFYMPFDKRRNIHCGFAFINFKAPEDVLALWQKIMGSIWRNSTIQS
ncbi:unnamed protein product, partial [Polarella glacialis]